MSSSSQSKSQFSNEKQRVSKRPSSPPQYHQYSGEKKYKYKTRKSFAIFDVHDSNVRSSTMMAIEVQCTRLFVLSVISALICKRYQESSSAMKLYVLRNSLSKLSVALWSTSLQSVQMCLLMSQSDKRELFCALNDIAASSSSSSISSSEMTFRVCLALQRFLKRKQSLIGGSMRTSRLKDNERNRNIILDEYNANIMQEKAKFDIDLSTLL